jgi:nickel/cobalt transporter (NicO) family protein
MNESLWLLAGTAASIGFIHTIIGPDHYLPFIMMAKARNWTRTRTLIITLICGIGHVLGSVLLGVVGIAFGIALQQLEIIEGVRGDIAAWALISFGILYALWGLRRAWKNEAHVHEHAHDDGTIHAHTHVHVFGSAAHSVIHHKETTFWALLVVFVLGPCEPLIPILMYPAATHSVTGMLLIASVFGVVTIVTMLGLVLLVSAGIERIPLRGLIRYTHAIAGGTIALSGLAIQFLGL